MHDVHGHGRIIDWEADSGPCSVCKVWAHRLQVKLQPCQAHRLGHGAAKVVCMYVIAIGIGQLESENFSVAAPSRTFKFVFNLSLIDRSFIFKERRCEMCEVPRSFLRLGP